MSEDLGEIINSTSASDDGPVRTLGTHRRAARESAARASIAAVLGKAIATERGHAATELPNPEPVAEVEAEPPPWLDLDAAKARRLAKRDATPSDSSGPDYTDLIDRPGHTVRGWIEGLRGEKFADDGEFKAEAADLVSRLATEVLGVPLPAATRAKLDAAAAKKMLKGSRVSQSKRESAARERAEREAHDAEWSRAAEMLDAKIASSDSYPLLAAENRPGETVIDVIMSAKEAGEKLTWEAAAKLAESHLRAQHNRRSSRLAPKAAAAKPAHVEAEPASAGPWKKATHRASTLAAFRKLTGGA